MVAASDGAMLLLRKELLLERLRRPQTIALLEEGMPPYRLNWFAAQMRLLLHQLGHLLLSLGQRLESYAAVPLAVEKR